MIGSSDAGRVGDEDALGDRLQGPVAEPHLGLGPAPGCDVNEGHHGAEGLAVAADRVGPVLDRDRRSVGPPEDVLLAEGPLAGPEGPEDRAFLGIG